MPCCSWVACRACATKSVTRNKTCWNSECSTATKTGDLINDEALREAVESFNNKRKEAEANKKEVENGQSAGNNAKENIEAAVGMNINEVNNVSNNEAKPNEMETPINMINGSAVESSNGSTTKNDDPPSKKAKTDESLLSDGVSLQAMKERNDEFDRCMLPQERESKELRFGAQLELMLDFNPENANCLICGELLKSEFIILKHVQLKHKKEYDQMKTVLGATNLNTLNMFLHKAIRSEFLYQQKQVFPIPVNY